MKNCSSIEVNEFFISITTGIFLKNNILNKRNQIQKHVQEVSIDVKYKNKVSIGVVLKTQFILTEETMPKKGWN